MRTYCCAALLIALSVSAAADEPAEVVLPRRITLAVRLDTNLKTNRSHAGDPVTATLVSAVLLHGVVVIPTAARLTGRVLVVQVHADDVPSRLIVGFQSAQ